MPGTEVKEGTTSQVKWLIDSHLPLAMKLILESECKLVDEFCPGEGHEGGTSVQVCKGFSQLHTAEHHLQLGGLSEQHTERCLCIFLDRAWAVSVANSMKSDNPQSSEFRWKIWAEILNLLLLPSSNVLSLFCARLQKLLMAACDGAHFRQLLILLCTQKLNLTPPPLSLSSMPHAATGTPQMQEGWGLDTSCTSFSIWKVVPPQTAAVMALARQRKTYFKPQPTTARLLCLQCKNVVKMQGEMGQSDWRWYVWGGRMWLVSPSFAPKES